MHELDASPPPSCSHLHHRASATVPFVPTQPRTSPCGLPLPSNAATDARYSSPCGSRWTCWKVRRVAPSASGVSHIRPIPHTEMFEKEKSDGTEFQPLPSHYIEISQILFRHSKSTFKDDMRKVCGPLHGASMYRVFSLHTLYVYNIPDITIDQGVGG